MNQDKILQYRFSNDELLLLNNLFEIYTDNGFIIKTWPETYFCNYADAIKKFDLSNEIDMDERLFNDEGNYKFSSDYLGIYKYKSNKEGCIIIFKDRIIEASLSLHKFNNIRNFSLDQIITLLKTKVLIHEVGHWLTHSCATICKNEIMMQFNFLPKIIKESLAQLTVIWSFYKRKNQYEYQLESFAREFMPLQPYPYYEFSKVISLNFI